MVRGYFPVQLPLCDDRAGGADGQYLAARTGTGMAGTVHVDHHSFQRDPVPPQCHEVGKRCAEEESVRPYARLTCPPMLPFRQTPYCLNFAVICRIYVDIAVNNVRLNWF